jgi:anaerobic selenocysteine-containing dehydrogenase
MAEPVGDPGRGAKSNVQNDAADPTWQVSACILCSANCGIQVQLGGNDGRQILRTRGDKAHPGSLGYLCNKASRLNHYISRADRLTSPMRRNADGSYEPIGWERAIAEIATKLCSVRDTHGGNSIFYYGGGGQGNHLPGAHARSTLATLGVKYRSNALAQEKTGEFWVSEHMLGGWAHGDFAHCEVAIFLGKNPWQSHGIAQARATIREISRDPARTLIVIDPTRTESADLADIHLAVKPARDAWLLAALAAIMVEEDLLDHDFITAHTTGCDAVVASLNNVPISNYAAICGISEAELRNTARTIANAKSVAVFEDLGVQMNRHSTLSSYLQRLLWLMTGNFGRPGTHYIANGLGNIGSGHMAGKTPVTGAPIIGGLIPCNSISEEILTDHPDRFRAMIVEAVNPVHSLAQSSRMREAMRALEVSVVIDVAMTETAREADYVLPATLQYEKAEATFFNFEFPNNYFQLRHPLFEAPAGVLSEAEIHARLVEAMGALPNKLISKLSKALETGRDAFREAAYAALAADPTLVGVAPALLHRTLGAWLTAEYGADFAPAAVLWPIAHQFSARAPAAVRGAGIAGEGAALGEALFDAMLESPSGFIFSKEDWPQTWDRVTTADAKIRLDHEPLLAELRGLADAEPFTPSAEFPFVLSAGERRAFTANTIIRDPDWKRKDREGALRINPQDARRLNLGDGARALITTAAGAAEALVELSDRMQPGHIALPNGSGLSYPDEKAKTGLAPNELTLGSDRDKFVGTPWHKSVAARLEAV